ncbi:EAL domain-containing protein [Roseobacter sinensis]|uniref:EAL domain-containing protein n=1 Tax=Roseobacter sinensis TaxID=2931391 RepID=A0ABT3BKC8_9RHOB|nr:EAL domain-containing protein [Roseobacter sp. WL0113]MCV3274030.1 EAL domain-containing protein [Roseobacter sp. WL0113]
MRGEGFSNAESFAPPLVEALAVPAFLLTPDYKVIAANTVARSIFENEEGDALSGVDLISLICPERRPAAVAHLDQIRHGTAPLDVAIIPLRYDEKLHIFSVTAFRDEAQEIQGFLGQCADTVQRNNDLDMWQSIPDDLPQRSWEFDAEDRTKPLRTIQTAGLEAPTAGPFAAYLDLVHPQDRGNLENALAALLSKVDHRLSLSYRVRMSDGSFATLFGKGSVTGQSATGVPTRITIVETDVSGHAEVPGGATSLAESERRWKTAVLSANQGVWDHDFERGRHFLSRSWRDLRGIGDEDPIPLATDDWLATIHPKDLPLICEELRRLELGETDVINYKFRQRHADGHWIWVLSRGRVVRRDADGLPARIIGTEIDITDIKTVEVESQRMAERLDVAMEAAGMARWEYNVNTNQAFWDDRLLKMFGVTDGENIRSGEEWSTFIHPDDREFAVAYTEECLREGRDVALDYRLLSRDGRVRHVRTRGKYVNDTETGPRYYGVNFDITEDKLRAQELEDARARLEHESRHDALTGLANRRRLDDVYTERVKTSGGGGGRLAVLHFDIDHFKQINDTLGHDAGDATLRHAARILLRNTPESALVSRVGGDEFVALFFDAPDHAALEEIAQKIITDMSRPFFYGSQECNIGTSIGIAVAEDMSQADNNMFIDADLALYEAKKAGRGRYRFYSTTMKEEARRRKNSFDALLAGFDQGEITCHYQPQFDAKTLELTGLEALVRWESARFGLIMPEEFLQTAEDMGLLAQFDELVLRRALYDMERWQGAGLFVPPISVNVSAHRLNDPSLADRLRELDLPRGMLSFELLESAFLDARNDVIDKNLNVIGEMGIDIEIDDFGSGHASIASLLQIAPKRLKIDRTLIQPIVHSQRQRDLVRTIIGIGRMLDIRVVAEGVETAAHVPILNEMGCCYLQGFGLARPMDYACLTGFLADVMENEGRLLLA